MNKNHQLLKVTSMYQVRLVELGVGSFDFLENMVLSWECGSQIKDWLAMPRVLGLIISTKNINSK